MLFVAGLGLELGLDFVSIRLVSCYAHVFVLLSIVIVTVLTHCVVVLGDNTQVNKYIFCYYYTEKAITVTCRR